MISIIIPTYNDEESLDLTLKGFEKQTLDKDKFEIWVVDDGSDIKPQELITKYEKVFNLRYIYQNNQGRAKARNAAKGLINGELVIFNDADRIPGPKFLEEHFENYKKNNSFVTIGNVKEIYFTNLKEKVDMIFKVVAQESRLARTIPIHKVKYKVYDENGCTDCHIPWITTFSGNMSVSKKLLDSIGWFDEDFKSWGFEHFELGYRLYKNGGIFNFNKRALNYHLAHKRDHNQMLSEMSASHKYFYEKHQEEVVLAIMDFMFGQINLIDLELIANRSSTSNMLDRLSTDESIKINLSK
ncbi:glycosyltransferase [Bacillus toyonensis]|uniref:glycosyltransferase n=1 Tax=Bacillus toyonensis TaxID=155322 RepID=UPI0018D0E22B|nr:glycosyltransferase [Bacillus toyonensis]MBH0357122.1 hypothetical protein [Bacillus toyonensis biovar Thuringiensis]